MNNYSNKTIDEYIKKFLANKYNAENTNKEINTKYLDLYYKSQYHSNYKTDDGVIKEILHNNLKSTKN